MPAEIAVVIPNWNTAAHLARCLESVRAQVAEHAIDLLVVDNGSTDGSLDLLRREGVRHLSLEENIGFARAVNLGAAHTEAPLLMPLNVDVTLEKRCVTILVRALAERPQAGGVQPRILQHDEPSERPRIYSTGQYLTLAGNAFECGQGEPDGPEFDQPREVFGVCGAVCVVRREMFEQLGGYDERYFAFYEDVDLNARARIRGWSFHYVPDAIAAHEGHASWRRDGVPSDFNRRLLVCNRAATGIKVLPRRSLPLVAIIVLRSTGGGLIRGMWRASFIAPLRLLRWLPRLVGERRELRRSGGENLDAWLGRRGTGVTA